MFRRSQLSRVGSFLFCLTVLAIPAAAQLSDVYVVPAIADTPGAGGTVWKTAFYLMNPQPHDLVVTAVFVPTGGAPGSVFDFDAPANMTVSSDNILAEFEVDHLSGSLLIFVDKDLNPGVPDDVASRAVVLQTRTFNLRPDGGTLGQAIDGAMTGLLDYELDGLSAIATAVRNLGAPGITGFRTNVGAVNLGDSSVTLRVTVWSPEGESLGTVPFEIPPQAHVQDALPIEVDHGSIEFFVEDSFPNADDFVFPYASVIDNKTGDAIYLDPKLLALPSSIFPFAAAKSDTVRQGLLRSSVRQAAAAAGRVEATLAAKPTLNRSLAPLRRVQ